MFSILSITSCKTQDKLLNAQPILITKNLLKSEISKKEKMEWQHKNILSDSIFGVNTDLAYNFTRKKRGRVVIVAVIDLEINTNHKDLQNRIWLNSNEIPDNGLDDDNNGYVDDINGWNFLGTTEKDSVLYQNSESARIIKRYKKKFVPLSKIQK